MKALHSKRIKIYLKFFLSRFKKIKNKKKDFLEEELYSLDEGQIDNLLDKKINFHFYSLDDLPEKAFPAPSFKKAQFKTKEEIVTALKDQDLKQPIVLICKDGVASKAFSQELREKGFINCYFLEKGFSQQFNQPP